MCSYYFNDVINLWDFTNAQGKKDLENFYNNLNDEKITKNIDKIKELIDLNKLAKIRQKYYIQIKNKKDININNISIKNSYSFFEDISNWNWKRLINLDKKEIKEIFNDNFFSLFSVLNKEGSHDLYYWALYEINLLNQNIDSVKLLYILDNCTNYVILTRNLKISKEFFKENEQKIYSRYSKLSFEQKINFYLFLNEKNAIFFAKKKNLLKIFNHQIQIQNFLVFLRTKDLIKKILSIYKKLLFNKEYKKILNDLNEQENKLKTDFYNKGDDFFEIKKEIEIKSEDINKMAEIMKKQIDLEKNIFLLNKNGEKEIIITHIPKSEDFQFLNLFSGIPNDEFGNYFKLILSSNTWIFFKIFNKALQDQNYFDKVLLILENKIDSLLKYNKEINKKRIYWFLIALKNKNLDYASSIYINIFPMFESIIKQSFERLEEKGIINKLEIPSKDKIKDFLFAVHLDDNNRTIYDFELNAKKILSENTLKAIFYNFYLENISGGKNYRNKVIHDDYDVIEAFEAENLFFSFILILSIIEEIYNKIF